MWRIHGDPEARAPEKKGCACRLCDGDLTFERATYLHARSVVTGHGAACDCEECQEAESRVRTSDIREGINCKLHGYSREVRYWADVYNSQIAQGYLDPRNYDLRYLQVAQIGDAVVNQVKSDRIDRAAD